MTDLCTSCGQRPIVHIHLKICDECCTAMWANGGRVVRKAIEKTAYIRKRHNWRKAPMCACNRNKLYFLDQTECYQCYEEKKPRKPNVVPEDKQRKNTVAAARKWIGKLCEKKCMICDCEGWHANGCEAHALLDKLSNLYQDVL